MTSRNRSGRTTEVSSARTSDHQTEKRSKERERETHGQTKGTFTKLTKHQFSFSFTSWLWIMNQGQAKLHKELTTFATI